MTETIFIEGDIASKIRFMASAMRDKPWSLNVVLPKDYENSPTKQRELLDGLKRTDAELALTRNNHDQLTLGLNYSPATLTAAQKAAYGAKEYAKGIFGDSARLIGAIYLMGDAMVTLSPMLNKSPTAQAEKNNILHGLKDPYNVMQYFQGISTVLQSIVYAHYARDGKDTLLNQLDDHLDIAQQEKQNPLDVKLWHGHEPEQSLWSEMNQFLYDHAITVGAGLMMAGQTGYIAGGLLRQNRWAKHLADYEKGQLGKDTKTFLETFATDKKISTKEKILLNKKAGLMEIGRGALSILTWATFIRTSKEHEKKANWNDDPFERAKQELDENPQRFAAIMSMASSAFGMYAGAAKGNALQKLGEGTYLGADALMFVTRKKDYGRDNAENNDIIIQAGAEFIANAPFALGAQAKSDFVRDLAEYFVTHEQEHKPDEKRLRERQAIIADEMEAVLNDTETAYDHTIAAAIDIIQKFPPEKHADVAHKLSYYLANQSTIYATPEEIEQSLQKGLKNVMHVQRKPHIAELDASMQRLVAAIPGMDDASQSVKLYDVIEHCIGTDPKKEAPTHPDSEVKMAKHLGQQQITESNVAI
ncbi:MAG: hypothetical protein MRY32_08380 [Rickettsiales bacterium]|nr:hypothetical protein [Rickettsiales bacterium]